jgi:CheY-like chemotaxis protein
MKTQTDYAASAGFKILLVDDVPQGTVARKSYLKGLGYEVESAENGQQALEQMGAHSFHLMVTDYKMPGMDGLELIREARAAYPAMRIILLSAQADTMGFTEESTGSDAVIAKSGSELNELTRTIAKLLAKKPARKRALPAKKPAVSQKLASSFMVKSS